MELIYQPVSLYLASFTNKTNRPMLVIGVFVGQVGIDMSNVPQIYDEYGNFVGYTSVLIMYGQGAWAVTLSFRPFVLMPNWSIKVSNVSLGVEALLLDSLDDLRGII